MRQESRSYITPTNGYLYAPPGGPPGGVSTDEAGRLVAENAELVGRVNRLSPVLVGMAQDLAVARRRGAALKRENRRLRSRVTTLEQRTASALRASTDRTIGSSNQRARHRRGWRPWQAQPGPLQRLDSPSS
jgi:hypothetical protein